MKLFLWFDNKIINYLNLKKKVIFIVLIIFFSTILEIVGLSSLIPLLTFLVKQDLPFDINLFFGFNFDNLTLTILFLFLIFVMISIRFLSLLFINYKIQKFLKNISFSLASKIITTYLSTNYYYRSNNHSSLAIKNITSEVELYCKLFYSRITIFSEIVVIIMIISVLLFFYFKVTVGTFIFLFFLFLLYRLIITKKIKLYGYKREYNQKNLNKSLFEIFNNYKLIKIFDQKNFFIQRFNKYQKDFKDVNYQIAFLNTLPKNIFEFIFIASLIFFLMINFIYFGKLNDQLIQLIVIFSITFYRIMPSVSKIILAIQSMNFNLVSEKVILDILEKNKLDNDENKNYKYNSNFTFDKTIKIENLSFKYPTISGGEKEILKNFNFTIKKGSFVGICGPSGSGKTTLMNILMKFEYYNSGEIYIDNTNFNKIKNTDWFSKISYVPENVYIHNDTIKNNIIFGEQIINEELFNRVIQQTNLVNFVKDQNTESFEKILNEKGNNISAGQIQRMGIARALYTEPEIIFLDEPTSNLDHENEQIIIDTLKNITPKITVIMISHRKSSLSKCDSIIKL